MSRDDVEAIVEVGGYLVLFGAITVCNLRGLVKMLKTGENRRMRVVNISRDRNPNGFKFDIFYRGFMAFFGAAMLSIMALVALGVLPIHHR